MRIIFLKLCDFVNNVTLTLEGTLGHDNIEIIEMKNEVLYHPLPSASKDRENLKQDGQKVIGDNTFACKFYLF